MNSRSSFTKTYPIYLEFLMVRLILVPFLVLIIFIVILQFSGGDMTPERKKKLIRLAMLFLTAMGLTMIFFMLRSEWKVKEQLAQQGYEVLTEGVYTRLTDDYEIEVTYSPGLVSRGQSIPRLDIKIIAPVPFAHLEEMFCNDREYQSFIADSHGDWYPTPEIKLPNNHFVGKCYPEALIEKIGKLPQRLHDFKPRVARYLFLPSQENNEFSVVHFHTDNLDISLLNKHIEDFLSYYQLLSSRQ